VQKTNRSNDKKQSNRKSLLPVAAEEIYSHINIKCVRRESFMKIPIFQLRKYFLRKKK